MVTGDKEHRGIGSKALAQDPVAPPTDAQETDLVGLPSDPEEQLTRRDEPPARHDGARGLGEGNLLHVRPLRNDTALVALTLSSPEHPTRS